MNIIALVLESLLKSGNPCLFYKKWTPIRQMSSVSQTLYVNHLCERIGIVELKRSLFSLFSPYGQILEIRAHRGLKRRGQAWITFQEMESAVKAKNVLDKYFLFDRAISVQFSHRKSVVTQKLAGTFNPYGRKAERISDLEAESLTRGAIPRYFDFDMESDSDEEVIVMEDVRARKPAEAPVNGLIPPNRILFVQHLPAGTDPNLLLNMLFGQYRGYVECRPVPMHAEIAFVEFETIDQATAALNALNGFAIDENTQMLIQYAK
jgi:RNA recognition motif-containing protein